MSERFIFNIGISERCFCFHEKLMKIEFSVVRWSIDHFNHSILHWTDHVKILSFCITLQKLILTELAVSNLKPLYFSAFTGVGQNCVCLFSKEKKVLKKVSARNPALMQHFANNLVPISGQWDWWHTSFLSTDNKECE